MSRLSFLLFIITLLISSIFLVKSEMKARWLIDKFKSGQFPTMEYRKYADEDTVGTYAFPMNANHEARIISHRNRKRANILGYGGTISVIILIVFYFAKQYEDKRNPIKNLELLRGKDLITDVEYEAKRRQLKNMKSEEKLIKMKKKQSDKLVSELYNLKSKGVLTEEEYQQKLKLIKENFDID